MNERGYGFGLDLVVVGNFFIEVYVLVFHEFFCRNLFCGGSLLAMKRKFLRNLPARTFGELYRLAALVKAYGLRHTEEIVMVDLRRIVKECPDHKDYEGWTDRRLRQWFFDHFLRPKPRRTNRDSREELFWASERRRFLEQVIALRRAEYAQTFPVGATPLVALMTGNLSPHPTPGNSGVAGTDTRSLASQAHTELHNIAPGTTDEHPQDGERGG